jgi:ribosomal protein RSM22 (predicted rRNA methylase)
MSLPHYLQEKITSLLREVPALHLKEARQAVTSRYQTHDPSAFQSQEERVSYLATRLPATYAVASWVLEKVAPYSSHLSSHLDLGTGPGTVFFAVQELFLTIQQNTLVEKDPALIELGKQLTLSEFSPTWQLQNLHQFPSFVPADLVTMSYVLNELKHPAPLILKAWEATKHFLVLIEPGTPHGFAGLKTAREQLIQQGAFILAPCTHENGCPLSPQDWCHFKVNVQRPLFHQRIKQGTKSFEEEKFCYLIASRISYKRSEARIVRKPIKGSGHIILDLCEANGLRRQVTSKKNGSRYRDARHAEWGDTWDD